MDAGSNKKKNLYKWVKVGGILSFIPFVLAAGPLGGFFLADYLEKRFGFPFYTTIICITLGVIGSTREVIRMIKVVLRSEDKQDAQH